MLDVATVNLNEQPGLKGRSNTQRALTRWEYDLPAPIRADVLDLDPTTAARWSRLLERDWAGHVVERSDAS